MQGHKSPHKVEKLWKVIESHSKFRRERIFRQLFTLLYSK